MGAALLAGRFTAPAVDELVHYGAWLIVGAGRAVGAWLQAPCGITHAPPPDGQHGRANPLPHGSSAGHVQLPAAAVVPAHTHALPGSLRLLEYLLQRWHARACAPWPPVRARLSWWSWLIQGRLHPQRGHQAYIPAGPGCSQVVHAVGLVADERHRHPRQPAAYRQHHRACAARDRLMPPPQPATDLRGGGGHAQHGHRPRPLGPGGVMTHVNTIQRPPLVAPERCLLEASGSRSCPRLLMRGPQRRANVSSMTKVSSPPTATKVRTTRTSRRRLHSNADQRARLST